MGFEEMRQGHEDGPTIHSRTVHSQFQLVWLTLWSPAKRTSISFTASFNGSIALPYYLPSNIAISDGFDEQIHPPTQYLFSLAQLISITHSAFVMDSTSYSLMSQQQLSATMDYIDEIDSLVWHLVRIAHRRMSMVQALRCVA